MNVDVKMCVVCDGMYVFICIHVRTKCGFCTYL